ncbi:MAG: hypothetical protein ACRD0N_12060 [Acidimicrobiales bacterium]
MSSNPVEKAGGRTAASRIRLAALVVLVAAVVTAGCGGGSSPDEQLAGRSGTTSPFGGDRRADDTDGGREIDRDDEEGPFGPRFDEAPGSSGPDPGPGVDQPPDRQDPGRNPAGGQSGDDRPGDKVLPSNVAGTSYEVPPKSADSGATTTRSGSSSTLEARFAGENNRMQRPPDLALAPGPLSGPGFIPADLIVYQFEQGKLVEISLGQGWYAVADGSSVVHWMPFDDHLALVARDLRALDEKPTVLATGRVATPPTLRNGTVVVALDPNFDPGNAAIAEDTALELYRLTADNSAAPERLTTNKAVELGPALSADAGRVAYASQSGSDFEIMVMGIDGGRALAVTDNEWDDLFPAWAPDGSHLAFAANKDGDFEIYAAKVAAGATPVQLTANSTNDVSPTWSTAGLTFSALRDGDYDLMRISGNTGTAAALTGSRTNDLYPVSSFDASAVAFSRVT